MGEAIVFTSGKGGVSPEAPDESPTLAQDFHG